MVGVPGDDEFFPAGFDFVIAGSRGNAQNVVIMLESRGRGRRTGFVIVADEFEIAIGEFNDVGSVFENVQLLFGNDAVGGSYFEEVINDVFFKFQIVAGYEAELLGITFVAVAAAFGPVKDGGDFAVLFIRKFKHLFENANFVFADDAVGFGNFGGEAGHGLDKCEAAGFGRVQIEFEQVDARPETIQKVQVEFFCKTAQAQAVGEKADNDSDEDKQVAVKRKADYGAEYFAPIEVPECFKQGFKAQSRPVVGQVKNKMSEEK